MIFDSQRQMDIFGSSSYTAVLGAGGGLVGEEYGQFLVPQIMCQKS